MGDAYDPATSATLLRELADRHQITDALHRYSRGIDRADRELALSAYHDDAIDDHGPVVLPASEVVDWALEMHAEQHVAHTHQISNIVIEIDGDVAHCESYFSVFCKNRVKPNMVTSGRYVDRFERRDGRWAIAARVAIAEGVYRVDDFAFPPGYLDVVKANGPAERSTRDISYERPLQIRRPIQHESVTMSAGGHHAAEGAVD